MCHKNSVIKQHAVHYHVSYSRNTRGCGTRLHFTTQPWGAWGREREGAGEIGLHQEMFITKSPNGNLLMQSEVIRHNEIQKSHTARLSRKGQKGRLMEETLAEARLLIQ